MPQKMPNFSTYAIFAENNCNGLSIKLEVLLLTSQNSEYKVQFSVSCLEHQAPAPIVSLGWLHAQMTLGEPTQHTFARESKLCCNSYKIICWRHQFTL